jgi:hypothetical protein
MFQMTSLGRPSLKAVIALFSTSASGPLKNNERTWAIA